ncbi:unnamed protein product [Linum tenue]|uniref:BSD domain-containing protein n=1 Tax=Linum tenue TaxID=586396 RepID=A0AAV0NX84_9ROSI|nr:unnamed protein product [Linum tenue]
MEDLWKRAKLFAEEAAKKSQTITSSSNKFADLVAETAKKSKELAIEASKKADEFKVAALKQADQIQIKSFSDIIPSQLSSLSTVNGGSEVAPSSSPSSSSSAAAVVSEEELRKFGITDDLRDFVKGLTLSTFQNFPVQDNPARADVPANESNVRKDLNEWQERHATLVLSTVKQISKLRYDLCPRVMKERRFWRIYFTLVSTHVGPYEQEYKEELKRKAEEQIKDEKIKQAAAANANPSVPEGAERSLESKKSNVSTEQDLDTFLLGDLEDSDGGADMGDDADGNFEDDFDKIDNSDIEDDLKELKKAADATTSS